MRYLALALAFLAPMPAFALSCRAPTIENSYAQFDAAKEAYVVVHGRLTLDMSKLPKGMTTNPAPPSMTRVPAILRGSSLNTSGFALPFEQKVMLEVACFGPWCGGAKSGEDVLAFVRKETDGYALPISPCGGSVFGEPKPAMLKRVKQCLTLQNCKPD
jgi:hypothetical protein